LQFHIPNPSKLEALLGKKSSLPLYTASINSCFSNFLKMMGNDLTNLTLLVELIDLADPEKPITKSREKHRFKVKS